VPEILDERLAAVLFALDFFAAFISSLLHAILQVSCQIFL
jgi:hypothetical protein